jgi:sialidase-1
MKQVLSLSLLVLISVSISKAQTLDAAAFHNHRQSLTGIFLKFRNDKIGRVAFLGGSITYNSGWRDSVCNYFQKEFPETKFDFVNAGVPSMGSTPGAFRFEKDVLKNGPVDLLFLEAAVNDQVNKAQPLEISRAMEGIVRHAKRVNPACEIVIMYFVDPDKITDYRAGRVPEVIQLHEKVAEYYGISTINLAKEVTQRIDNKEFDWENDFKDLHPSPFGQNVYFQSIKHFIASEIKSGKPDRAISEMPLPIDKYCYSRGVLVEPNPPKKINGWTMVKSWNPADGKGTRRNFVDVPMLAGEYPGKIIKFQFKGNAVGVAVAAGPDAGIIEYSIDESEWEKLDLFTPWSKNLHLPWFYTLGTGLKNGKHTLQIRLTDMKNPESSGNKCVIRYFYVNGAE